MAKWLVKSEPNVYSFEQLQVEKITAWTGVRNYAARLNLRAMKLGDECFFYHSNIGKAIVGVAKVVREAYPDPTATEGDWSCVDIAPVKALAKPVSLEMLKAMPEFSEMELIKFQRLSVQKVTEHDFKKIIAL